MNQLHSSAIILAAGLSERMGIMKPLLRFDDQHNFIEHIIDDYSKIITEDIVVVINKEVKSKIDLKNNKKIRIIINDNTEEGRMSSAILGTQALKYRKCCFIHNVDNPFVNFSLLENMVKMTKEDNCVMPIFKGKGGHPILFGEKVIDHIAKAKSDDDFREALRPYDLVTVETDDESILVNINTRKDYQKYFKYKL